MTLSHVDITPIQGLVQELWDRGGTDIHLTVGAPPQLRIDGELHPVEGQAPLTEEDTEDILRKMLPGELWDELERRKEIDFSFSWGDLTRFRGNAYHQRGAASVALRVIPYRIPTMQELLLPPVVEHLAGLSQGLLLMTGPTGSGKSTTQAAMIGYINNTRRKHILTLEDPVEYVHRHNLSIVSQREVGVDTDSFYRGLRSALREDPDIVLVGEMRDPESIQAALTIAETGHLVLATLHTNDASTALDRIVDVFPSERQAQIRVQLGASLAAVLAQRLVTRIGGGRIAAFEILIANSAVRGLIREGKTHQIRNVISQSVRDGMQTLEQSLSALVSSGVITYDEALEHCLFPKELRPPVPVAGQEPVMSPPPPPSPYPL